MSDSHMPLFSLTGTGGEEAALFTAEIFNMYERYAASRGWQFKVLEVSEAEHGGMKVQCRIVENAA